MSKQQEALRLALEALEDIKDDCSGCEFEWSNDYPLQAKAHAAIKEALAQPAQKCSYPYCGCNSKAWCKVERNEALDKMAENARELGLDYEPAQQEPVAWYDSKTGWTDFHPFKPARKPSAPDAEWLPLYTTSPQPGEKNQEPVLWMMPDGKTVNKWGLQFYSNVVGTPLYTQSQRTWVGLSDEEIFLVLGKLQAIYNRPPTEDSRIVFAHAIEAKLKEKNGG